MGVWKNDQNSTVDECASNVTLTTLSLEIAGSLRSLSEGDCPELKQWNSPCMGLAVIYAELPKVSSIYFLAQSAQRVKCLKKWSILYTLSLI